jgi:hypothetical protein
MAMNNSGASFSVATTVFVSLAICAVISYGVFYYFKQRISVIEQSQMEQARIMQSFIARSIMHQQHQQHPHARQDGNQLFQEHLVHKEVTITESGLIEVSSDSESESSDSDSESESTTSESSSDCDNESGSGSGSESESRPETKRIQIQIQSLPDAEVTDVIDDDDDVKPESSTKKIISLNKTALGDNDDNESDDDDDDDDDNDNDNGESESGSEHHPDPDHQSLEPFELNIGYKTKPPASKIHLNYGNMSVSALRQLAKERGLGGDDGDLQKLKKKDIVQLLQ